MHGKFGLAYTVEQAGSRKSSVLRKHLRVSPDLETGYAVFTADSARMKREREENRGILVAESICTPPPLVLQGWTGDGMIGIDAQDVAQRHIRELVWEQIWRSLFLHHHPRSNLTTTRVLFGGDMSREQAKQSAEHVGGHLPEPTAARVLCGAPDDDVSSFRHALESALSLWFIPRKHGTQ